MCEVGEVRMCGGGTVRVCGVERSGGGECEGVWSGGGIGIGVEMWRGLGRRSRWGHQCYKRNQLNTIVTSPCNVPT